MSNENTVFDELTITKPQDGFQISGTDLDDQAPYVSDHQVIKGPVPSVPSSLLTCLRFFSAGVGRVGIRNNCPECKMAVVMWNQGVGIRRYRVNGNSQIVIRSIAQFGELIGEDPC